MTQQQQTGASNGREVQSSRAAGNRIEPSTGTAAIEFNFENQAVRTIVKDGETWFVATDVCAVLAHTNPTAAVARLDDDEKGLTTIETKAGPQTLNVVSESGLYHLIVTSRKPQAKAFRRWVTHEVLPAIRQTGRYETHRSKETPKLERERVHVALPGPGRFVVTMAPGGPLHIHQTPYDALLADVAKADCRILSAALMLIESVWHKVEHLRSTGYDPSDGFVMDRLAAAIQEGGRLGVQYLRVYDELST
jgi:prophage antirepressor-like protein